MSVYHYNAEKILEEIFVTNKYFLLSLFISQNSLRSGIIIIIIEVGDNWVLGPLSVSIDQGGSCMLSVRRLGQGIVGTY